VCGAAQLRELKSAAAQLVASLEHQLGTRRLNEIAPARVSLQSGRQTKVHYERGKPPWIASRLQDFFA